MGVGGGPLRAAFRRRPSGPPRVLMAFCLSLCFPVVAVMFLIASSSDRPLGLDPLTTVLLASALGAVQFALYLVSFLARSIAWYRLALSSLVAFTAMASTALAIRVHADFLKPLWTLNAGAYVLIVFRPDALGAARGRVLRALTVLAGIGVALFSVWVLAVSYLAIAGRHPEPHRLLYMNVYSAIVLATLVTAISWARTDKRRLLEIAADRLVIDGFDFSGFLTHTDLQLLACLLSRGGTATCGEMAWWLATKEPGGKESADCRGWNCEICRRESYTASCCPRYKNLYNRILRIRKLLEAFRIGSLHAPENKLRIRDEGWRIRFAKDVEVRFESRGA